ncbi:MAG: polysaccharide deacetylase family protein [Clostridia bacterium]|nr:polysaccharide deacetylase family protein [Clostridia bacterium]
MKFVVLQKSSLIKFLVVNLVTAIVIAVCFFSGSAVVWQNKTTRKIPIYSVETEEKVVALSFDAAWGADKTLGILDVLTSYDIKANFFAVGFWVEKHGDTLKVLHDSGRMEIGTHSNTHPYMSKLSKDNIRLELKASCDLIEQVTGVKPELFRAPYGDYSDTLLIEAESLGLYTIQWDVDSLDWKGLSANDIAVRVLEKADNGSIILMHNDGEHTLEALPLIIEGLKNRGFTFKTIGEMIYRDNFTVSHDGTQIRS